MHRNGVVVEEEETATIHGTKVDYDLCDEKGASASMEEEEVKQCIKLLLVDIRNDEDKCDINSCNQLLLYDNKNKLGEIPIQKEMAIQEYNGGRKRKVIILQDVQILPPKRRMEAAIEIDDDLETIVIDTDDDSDL